MYNVSNDYKIALRKPYKVRRITGTIGTLPFDDENIAQGSLIIENQCSDGEDVRIGTVFMGQLTCTFQSFPSLKGNWKGKVITLSEGLMLADGTYEDVPLGIFTIDSADHRDDGVAVTAYDNMRLLDKKFGITTTTGSAWDILFMISRDCGIELAQTENEIKAFPNGTKGYVLYAENSIETYRDVLAWISQAICAFATIDRQGKLVLRQYGSTSVDTITATDRWRGASFSDFVTYYTGVSVVKIEDESTRYVGLTVDDGLTYNLGSNPFLQSGNIDNFLNEILQGLQAIHYTPFEFDRSGCPAYDLGDVLTFEDGNGEGCTGCLMSFEYTYHSTYNMEGFGSNPALANARSKTDKEISGLMKKNSVANKLQFYTYTNAKEYRVKSQYVEIINIKFGSLIATRVTFQAEIKLNASLEVINDVYNDIVGTIKYTFNGIEMDYKPVETWFDGDHLMHLLYFFTIEEMKINRLSVEMKCDNGEIVIHRGSIQAAVSGQGLAASDSWDGEIHAEDTIGEATLNTEPTVVDFDESVSLTLQNIISINVTDDMDTADLETEPEEITDYSDAVYLNKGRLKDLTWGTVKDYKWTAEGVQNPITEDEYAW